MYLTILTAMLLGTSLFAQQNMNGIVQDFLSTNAEEVNLKSADVAQWRITDIVPSLNPEIQHVYVQQMYQNIPIQNGTYKLTVKQDKVTWQINQFIKDVEQKSAGAASSLTPENAILAVVKDHKIQNPRNLSVTKSSGNVYEYGNSGISLEPIKVEKRYLAIDGKLHLTWNVSLYEMDAKHWWNVNVDASSGAILSTEDWVISCSFEDPNHLEHNHGTTKTNIVEEYGPVKVAEVPALVGGGSYNVYPLGIESPNHGSRVIVTDPAVANASPFGWHDTNGSAGAEFTITRGNNVYAQDDINGNNGFGSSPNGGANLNFDFSINLNSAPSTYLSAATTNLFYWNNIMHDVWYQYGFTEAAGNFQENNYGKGGIGSDSVTADAQDGIGTNNANFSTPPDGGNPRMQMFLFTNPTRDGDLDNVVIAHEYGHGISTRLVGGPSTNALGGSEQMGEGWSDWLGLVMTIRPGDTRDTARGVGTFVSGQDTDGPGIRPTRYATNLAVNGTTYDNISGLSVPHGVGYGFATILWDITWDLIDLEGYDNDLYTGNGGNNIAMALVIEGLKNTANSPGYVSGRDGILQADQDLYGGQYNCLIWDAFARRGVGVDAVENSNGGTNTNTDQVASFISGCSGPPQPASCNSTIASFPYAEGFENTLGGWSQDTSDDFDWTVNSGGTPSNNTGPAGANEGTFYIYVEASAPNFGDRTTILNSPCFDLSEINDAEATFSYQMTGNAVGIIRLEARDEASQTWTEIWSQSGDQGANWQDATVDLSQYSDTVQLRFRATTADSWQGDIAIDGFGIDGSSSNGGCTDTTSVPYEESFEANLGLWSQNENDDINWTRDSGGTPSAGTGPTSGADGAFYMYVEASGNGDGFPNRRAILESPCFDLSGETDATFSFDYHMFGSTDGGRVDLEASDDGGATWTSLWNQTGNQGNQWNSVSINLATYTGGTVQLRFNRITGGTWQSDVAIDNVTLTAGGGSSGCSMVDLDTTYNSFANQDQGITQLLNGNTEVRLADNAWKFIDFPYTVTTNTVLQLEFRSDIQGEIHGIAFESDNTLSSDLTFQFHGTQDWGILDFNNYPNNGQWVTYNIPVGSFYTGVTDRLLFVADHDAAPSNGDSFFRNVTVFEDANGNGVCDNSESNVVASFGDNTNALVGNNSTEGVDFEIFPNPVTRGELNIDLKGSEATSLTIYNLLGQIVRKGGFEKTIDVSRLEEGIYIIEVQTETSKMIKRFIKK